MYGNFLRARIIKILLNKPQNTNQIAKALKVDYKTIQYHLRILEKNNLVSYLGGKGFAKTYFPSRFLEDNVDSFDEILRKIENKEIKKR